MPPAVRRAAECRWRRINPWHPRPTPGGPHGAFRHFPQGLPPGTVDVISTEDEVGPNLSLRVHPVDDPTQIAYVVFDQLALYDE
jgi:hypothetical protein